MEHPLADSTHIGSVHLRVPSLKRSLEFYATHLGLHMHPTSERSVRLTARQNGPEILRLTEEPRARPRPPHTTGLFHAAIRLPNREALAETLRRLVKDRVELSGFADHGVSEALYLTDPDGIGIELYADLPRAEWPEDRGKIAMVSNPLDVESLLALAGRNPNPVSQIHPDTEMGHVHLQVANLSRTEEYYAGELGFHVTQRSYPGALFFAAGDYHHHIGANTWAGRGAARPPENAIGLIAFSIVIPALVKQEELRVVRDPDGHEIELIYLKPDETETAMHSTDATKSEQP